MQNTSTSTDVNIEAIQRKAYELWLKGGCRDGVAEQNWTEAERLVRAEQAQDSARQQPRSDPPRALSSEPVQQMDQRQNGKKSVAKRH